MMEKKKFEIGAVKALLIYLAVDTVFVGIICMAILMITKNIGILRNIALNNINNDVDAIIFLCFIGGISIFISTLIFMVILKNFFTINKQNLEKFLKRTIVLVTFIYLTSMIVTVCNNYTDTYFNINNMYYDRAYNLEKYAEDPDNYEGMGRYNNCKTSADIYLTTQKHINNFFIEKYIYPVVGRAIGIVVRILSLTLFSKLFFKYEKE